MAIQSAPRAPYASDPALSRGRIAAEPASPSRNDFRRDCDRIIHSAAFRRLKYKTQVFVFHEGDHYRTRLTHTLEVQQIARSLARVLGLDEDLAEALSLAHDLGHPPFGHIGERALDEELAPYGGFDHNAQALRIVTALERRYADFDGLNLTWETLEGLVKHNGPLTDRDGNAIGRYRDTGVPQTIRDFQAISDLQLWSYASAEAQVAAISDDIAYDAHDIDDGLRAGLFAIDDLDQVPFAGGIVREIRRLYPGLEPARFAHELIRRLITWMIEDVAAESGRRLIALAPRSADEVRQRTGRRDRLFERDGGGRTRHQGFPVSAHVSSRAGHARHGRGGRASCATCSGISWNGLTTCRMNGAADLPGRTRLCVRAASAISSPA